MCARHSGSEHAHNLDGARWVLAEVGETCVQFPDPLVDLPKERLVRCLLVPVAVVVGAALRLGFARTLGLAVIVAAATLVIKCESKLSQRGGS